MNTVANMHADLLVEEDFYIWEQLLKKYFKPAPAGFTAYYCMEFAGGKMIYKRLASPDIDGQEHIFVQSTEATRKARLKELLNLPPYCTMEDIISKNVELPHLVPKQLAQSKISSIDNKLLFIPAQYRGYYPGAAAAENRKGKGEGAPQKEAKTREAREARIAGSISEHPKVHPLAGQMIPLRLVEK